jgi:hypothetical protein
VGGISALHLKPKIENPATGTTISTTARPILKLRVASPGQSKHTPRNPLRLPLCASTRLPNLSKRFQSPESQPDSITRPVPLTPTQNIRTSRQIR